MTRFRAVVLDADNTLAGIEGVDLLAALRGPALAAEVAALTDRAMRGDVPLEEVYGRRLALIRPTAAEVSRLAERYIATAAPGARDAVARLRQEGVDVHVVSGGVRQALLPFAAWLGLAPERVHAVTLNFDAAGEYAGFDAGSPLTRADGKPALVAALALPPPVLAVGDGMTDLAIRGAGATFAAFTGFTHRAPVVAAADHVIESFDGLLALVCP